MNFNFKFYTDGIREFFYWEDNTSLFNYRYQPIKKDLDFTHSLLDFLDLYTEDYFDVCNQIGEEIQKLYKDPNSSVKSLLFSFDKLSGTHVYFEFLRLQWHEKLNSFAAGTLAGDIREELRYKDITHIPMNINTAQDQIKYMFKNALDTTAIREQAEQYNVTDLYDKTLRSDGNPFEFRQITTGFERIGDSEMVEVLYPADMLDIVDYTLREIIRREIKFKVCKNCGEYFPTIAHGNTEFCNRLYKGYGKTCHEIGSLVKWRERVAASPAMLAYNKAYKTRFSRIRTGKITRDEFRNWAGQARDRRELVESGEITLDEFELWLRT